MTFSSPVATAEFSKFADILSAAFSQHHLSGFSAGGCDLCTKHDQRGATPHPRPGAVARRSNPTSKEQWLQGQGGPREAIPR